ncbi:histidine triad nucleotide-binding protein [Allonocardiopsis opalescens]|uniref:Histidine triad (HIT) family protein n=1 Tax=Allonocardiopsis opalescens TaxID=1144618 RepID=A0A2T0QFK0_9ACTN|nr:histidine triad nucleotide-binding protein [Allonocardiopsis opalescens]PRY02692.1 histidine triad (HIT) family protein [Allonocardiopsis opalescens]
MTEAAGTAGADRPFDAECLFCKIVSGAIPAEVVLDTPRALAFRDINPQAPLHVLVIPKGHYRDVAELAAAGGGLLDELVLAARDVAVEAGAADKGYRVVFNVGAGAGQTVYHTHAHVLGGRGLTWPPG